MTQDQKKLTRAERLQLATEVQTAWRNAFNKPLRDTEAYWLTGKLGLEVFEAIKNVRVKNDKREKQTGKGLEYPLAYLKGAIKKKSQFSVKMMEEEEKIKAEMEELKDYTAEYLGVEVSDIEQGNGERAENIEAEATGRGYQ
jgi:hypothetical protein